MDRCVKNTHLGDSLRLRGIGLELFPSGSKWVGGAHNKMVKWDCICLFACNHGYTHGFSLHMKMCLHHVQIAN